MTPEELVRNINAGSPPMILDVRSKKEFDEGHVPGAMHVPFWKIGRLWRSLQSARDEPIVVYCGHGPRAYIAGTALKRRGFTDVSYLAGHMKRWKKLRLPLHGSGIGD